MLKGTSELLSTPMGETFFGFHLFAALRPMITLSAGSRSRNSGHGGKVAWQRGSNEVGVAVEIRIDTRMKVQIWLRTMSARQAAGCGLIWGPSSRYLE